MSTSSEGKDLKSFKKPSPEQLKKQLSPLQYEVTQANGTEAPFANPYHNNEQAGIYVDIVSGEPLFSSKAQFHSGSGWPSFFEPLESKNIVRKEDRSHGMTRIEVRSVHGNSHLGHLFDDGPKPTGKRYCINSAALRFIPVAKLKEEGYEEYLALFTDTATFAGGCFWCMEPAFAEVPGVLSLQVGYTGGTLKNPSYEQVSAGKSGHVEALQITFDPSTVSYEQLLAIYWHNIDPTTKDRQFCDVGTQYQSVVFYHNDAQKTAAVKSRDELAKNPKITKIMTEITLAGIFYPAEDYHQQY